MLSDKCMKPKSCYTKSKQPFSSQEMQVKLVKLKWRSVSRCGMFLPSRSRNKLNFFNIFVYFFYFKAASSEDSAGFKNDSNNIKVPSMTYVKDHSTMSQIQPTCAMRLWWVTTLQWNLQPEWTGRYQGSETPAWWQMQRCTSIIE